MVALFFLSISAGDVVPNFVRTASNTRVRCDNLVDDVSVRSGVTVVAVVSGKAGITQGIGAIGAGREGREGSDKLSNAAHA